MNTKELKIRRMTEIGSKQWGIYRGSVLIEGGFFHKDSALDRIAEWTGHMSSSHTPRTVGAA